MNSPLYDSSLEATLCAHVLTPSWKLLVGSLLCLTCVNLPLYLFATVILVTCTVPMIEQRVSFPLAGISDPP